jgi:phosphatidate phosphatase PAH1
VLVVGCSRPPRTDTVTGECAGVPIGRAASFEHKRSSVLAQMAPRHRGVDLIALETDPVQTFGGKLAYGPSDKDLQDEAVDIFACVEKQWSLLGTTKTNGDGRFTLALEGAQRLPAGLRDLYLHVPGDRTGARFLAYVAKVGETVVVTDIDGTITASEDAVWDTVLRGRDIPHQPSAPEVLAGANRIVVYVTARGDQLTQLTRDWLATHGFPKGPLRLAAGLVTLPGSRTIELKTRTLKELGVLIHAGIGNRATDIAAYTNAGLTPDRIFINLPEFIDEVKVPLAEKAATAFDDYQELATKLR